MFLVRSVQLLLSKGASPDLVCSKGVAAIHLAVGKETEKNIRCLKMLLQRGADPNVRYEIFAFATVHRVYNIVKCNNMCIMHIFVYQNDHRVYYNYYCFISFRSSEGLTPLHIAALWGCYQNVKLLLINGGNPNIKDNVSFL